MCVCPLSGGKWRFKVFFCFFVSQGVKAGNFTILQLVEALGSQSQTRARGIQLLSHVLSECSGRLSEKEVEVLVAFYENRLKDDYVVTPHVLHGIKALSPAWPPGLAISVLKSLFQDVHVQVKPHAVPTFLFPCLYSTELKGLGADFVFGFVQAMDGERDPRNLLLAFQIARNILHRGYELGSFTEELFEVTSCYFPIDFSPPPNDPHGITQQELILALRAVLTGTVCFAEFLLPLVIEKLDSDIQSAKLDSLQTLAACASMYGYRELKEFLPGLWSSLRREVFQTASEKVESAGLSSLRAITSCLSRSILSSDGDDALRVFLDLIIQDCRHHLCEPDLKLVWPSAKLLQAAASASYRASHIIAGAVIPQLMEQYNNQTQARGETLPVLTCSSCLFLLVAGLLSTSHVELAVDHLRRLILEEEDTQVCPAVLECSGSLAPLYPDVFASAMIPQLKAEIFSEPMLRDNGQEAVHTSSQHVVRQRCMTALAAVSCHPTLVQQTAPVLLQVLSSSHTGNCALSSGLFSTDDIIAACRSLQQIAEQVQYAEETGCFFHDVIIPHLLGLTVQAGLHSFHLCFKRLFRMEVPVSNCCVSLLRLAALTASRVVSLFLDGDTVFLPGNNLPLQPQLGSQLVCLLMACVCSMPKSVEIPQVDRLLSELEELSCTSTHPFSFTLAAKCFAGLINKRSAGQALDLVLERTIKRITSELDCMSSSLRTQALTLLLWVAKALLIRYHPLATTLTDKIFSLLMDPELAPLAADGFSLLMSDSVDVLNRACHADFRIMYRQRFFTENSAKLVEGFNSAEKGGKGMGDSVMLCGYIFPQLLPLLLEALSCPDQAVQLSTLSCLHPVLLDPPASPALAPQLDGLIFRLLGLTTSPAMKVRIATLRCLHALARFPDHMILPFRARVLRALATPLDDHKLSVPQQGNPGVSAQGLLSPYIKQ
uniref:MMS19 nucleotide excision repair protein n=1 Tax=Scleropages formosus TaxID=113540 RepID=A0A8C9TTI0_SCLFO